MSRRRRFPNAPPLSPNDAERAGRLVAEFAAWATRRGFAETEHGFAGNVLGHAVTVHPGLDGSLPRAVEAEIAIVHDFAAPVLLKKPDARTEAPDVAVLFDELPALRSIGIFAGGVRLRLDALVDPDVVDAAVDRAITFFEERLRARARDDPYR